METAMRKPWTKEALDCMIFLYPDFTAKEISEITGMGQSSIYRKAQQLCLNKSEAFNKSIYSGRLSRATHNFAAGQFKKGHQPYNKGKKLHEFMSEKGIQNFKKTCFKISHLPHNTLSNGEITIRKDKHNHTYKFIRVALGIWKPLHVHNWESSYGSIPENHVIVFKTSDRMNCDTSNLELVSRAELMARNTIQRYPEELKQTMKYLSKLNNEIHGKE
jgi:hypothetical protein